MNEYVLLPYPFFFLILTYGYITMKMKNFFFKVIIPLMVFCLWFYFLPVADIINKYVTPIQDNYETLNTLFTGLAFWGAYMAYRTQNKALKTAKKQTAIAKEQRMDAACFELLNYLETRKKAIVEKEEPSAVEEVPFACFRDWYASKKNRQTNDLAKTLREYGTWYRIVMSWIDRVVTAFPNDKELQKKYVDNLLFSLSINELRCLKCYSHSADNISYDIEYDKEIMADISACSPQLRPFLSKNEHKDEIQERLKTFFQTQLVDSKRNEFKQKPIFPPMNNYPLLPHI